MKGVRCRRCGGHPMECPREDVSVECHCKISDWSQFDGMVLFVWDEKKMVMTGLQAEIIMKVTALLGCCEGMLAPYCEVEL